MFAHPANDFVPAIMGVARTNLSIAFVAVYNPPGPTPQTLHGH